MTALLGITWDHPRAMDALVAATAEWHRAGGQEVRWTARPLQAFADQPIDELARDYDLLVLDHPHIAQVAAGRWLLPLNRPGREHNLRELADQSVGGSFASYTHDGHQWALPIDAAAQVAVHRGDLLPDPPRQWPDVLELARERRILWPGKPVDAISTFLTLAANRGSPAAADPERFVEDSVGLAVFADLHALAEAVPAWCLGANPIEVAEALCASDDHLYAPFLYGYTNYSRSGFRRVPLRYLDIPARDTDGPIGSCLGGAGIGVSARTRQVESAVDYAYWVCSAGCQRGPYFAGGGQPANRVAWEDDHTNAECMEFFRGTRATMDGAWVRPAYIGWLDVQAAAGETIVAALVGDLDDSTALGRMEECYARSRDATI